MIGEAVRTNARIWSELYESGKGDLQYPSDILVRVGARLLDSRRDRRILDFGCGTGANLTHFASQGFDVTGVDVAEHALERTRARLKSANLSADLRLVAAGERLPFEDGRFDAAYAWQVLYYSDTDGWRSSLAELERVCKKGARIVVATAAPGDISQVQSIPIGDFTYRSLVPGQEGCIMTIPDRESLPRFFPEHDLDIGEFGFEFGSMTARHWIVSFRT
jgi:SAM-dependent methyltransferase